MKNQEAKLAKSKYLQVSELGSKFNLSFSGHLVLSNKIIALDGRKRSLLVFETNRAFDRAYVIELDKVAAITVKKTYGSISPGELSNKGMEEFLKGVDLQFKCSNKNDIIVLSFYDYKTDDLRDLPWLEKYAKNWQIILSKMAGSKTDKIIKKETGYTIQ